MPRVPDPRRWSLATRLTLFLSLAMGSILLAVAWLMDDQLEHQLHEKDEIELAHAIDMQLDIVRLMQTAPGEVAWARVWLDHMQPKSDVAVRILAPDGSVFTASPGMAVPVDAFVPVPGHRFQAWRPTRGDGPRYLLTTGVVATAPGVEWRVQAAADLTVRHELLERFHARLREVMACAMLVALLAGWLLVQRGLAPLRAMSARIGGVNAQRLHTRIGQQPWPSDLQALARAFDDMLDRLEAAFEQLSRFSSDLAHEFRSPITNLVAAASVMLARERSASEYQDTLEVIVEEGERLSRMVSSMLFLARADNARQVMTPAPVDIADEFSRMVDAFEAVAEEAGVALTARGGGTVVADPMLLRRALTNLLSNALAHTGRGGRIELSATSGAEGVTLSVRDSGVGIAEPHLGRLFDRFYRVDAARSGAESTGLGLAVVKSILELHAGRVGVQSVVGQGSVFTLHFPQRASPEPFPAS